MPGFRLLSVIAVLVAPACKRDSSSLPALPPPVDFTGTFGFSNFDPTPYRVTMVHTNPADRTQQQMEVLADPIAAAPVGGRTDSTFFMRTRPVGWETWLWLDSWPGGSSMHEILIPTLAGDEVFIGQIIGGRLSGVIVPFP